MADGDLTSTELDLAFDFSRSESGGWRDAAGALQIAAPGVARFDHDPVGKPLGLLITPGVELGGADRCTVDPLILPIDLLDTEAPGARNVTVFHRFDTGSGEQRRACYSRNVTATIDALLRQAGHHIELGVVRGHRPNVDGFIHFRGEQWLVPAPLTVGGAVIGTSPVLGDGAGHQLIVCGAEPDAGG